MMKGNNCGTAKSIEKEAQGINMVEQAEALARMEEEMLKLQDKLQAAQHNYTQQYNQRQQLASQNVCGETPVGSEEPYDPMLPKMTQNYAREVSSAQIMEPILTSRTLQILAKEVNMEMNKKLTTSDYLTGFTTPIGPRDYDELFAQNWEYDNQ